MAADTSDLSAPDVAGRAGRFESVRQVVLHTLPGRLFVVGGALKLFTWLLRAIVEIPVFDIIGSIGSIGVVIGVGYFAYKLILRAKRRLLWRVRRKLILSYIFVGVVPVLLVVAFFLLAGLLLFLNVGSYLVVSSLRQATEDARFLAQTTASDLQRGGLVDSSEVLARRRATLAARYADASVALVPRVPRPCTPLAAGEAGKTAGADGRTAGEAGKTAGKTGATAGERHVTAAAFGPWEHLAAPSTLPSWVGCAGFGGLLAVTPKGKTGDQDVGLVIRAVGVPPGTAPDFAIVVDIPLDAELRARVRDDTSVKLGKVSLAAFSEQGVLTSERESATTSLFRVATGETSQKRRIPWMVVLDWVDWTRNIPERATIEIEVNISDIYNKVSAARIGAYTLGTLFVWVLELLAVLFLIIEVVALIMGLVLARSITGSVHQLFTGTERVREGDFSHKIEISSRDQMGELADSFNTMTASIEDLLRQAHEKKRLEEELRIARAIQMSLLPRGELNVPGLSITALCVPAREVGGDYYDLLPLDDRRLGVLIADVSGKGTSAALYMAELKGLMLSLSRIHQSPRQLLIEANRIIADNLDSRSFITMTYAVIDLQSHTMTYARAGHTPLIHCTANGRGGEVHVLTPDGLVVGLQMGDGGALFERLLKEETVALHEGDVLMFFTDGITEAMNGDSDCFGEGRLSEILAEHGDLPSEELRERILREIDAFVAGAPQHDDMTMILMKVEHVAAAADGAAVPQTVSQAAPAMRPVS